VKYHHTEVGLNSRLDELQAAILRVKFRYLDRWNQARRDRAYRYNLTLQGLQEIERPHELAGPNEYVIPLREEQINSLSTPVYHQYTIMLEDRDHVARALAERGIASFPYYPVPLHLQKVHTNLSYGIGDFPHAERAAKHCLSLPMFPELSDWQQDQVASALGELTATAKAQQAV
jgi:dTDP-4-amino-4,6-dideoxygalactose transaminase